MSKRILVVDDSGTVRQQLKQLLSSNNFEVDEASNGSEGLSKATADAYDLILTDVNMPVMNGIEMVEKVRALDQHSKTPIFVLTTEAGADMAKKGKAAGATAWIAKPFKPDILVKGISKVLGL